MAYDQLTSAAKLLAYLSNVHARKKARTRVFASWSYHQPQMVQEFPQWLARLEGLAPSLVTASATLVATGITALATFLGTFLVVFFGWLRERGENTRRSQLIKEATDQAVFWKQWYEAQLLACPPNHVEDLQTKIKSELDAVGKELRTGITRPAKPHSTIRRALLLYQPANFITWAPRVLFYYLVFKAIWLVKELLSQSSLDALKNLVKECFKNPGGPPPDHISVGVILAHIDPGGLAIFIFVVTSVVLIALLYMLATLIVRAIATDLDKDPNLGGRLETKALEVWHRWIFPRS